MTDARRITLEGRPVEYVVRESDRATRAKIQVGVAGVSVVIPTGVDADPEGLLRANAEWVRERDAEYEATRARVPDRTFAAGARFPYLGGEREVAVEQRSRSVVTDEAFVLARWEVERTSVKNALESLYRRLAREHFESRLDHYADAMDVTYDAVHVRNQRTRWGSCSTSGTISLNWRLLLAPPRIADYVVVHELAHVIEPNHSERFWRVVGAHDPDYAVHREWLADNGVTLVFDESDL